MSGAPSSVPTTHVEIFLDFPVSAKRVYQAWGSQVAGQNSEFYLVIDPDLADSHAPSQDLCTLYPHPPTHYEYKLAGQP